MRFPPACLFPTTTVFLDDDAEFLSCLKRSIKHEHTLSKSFTCHNSAKYYLDNSRPLQTWKDSWLKTSHSEANFENLNIEIQFSKILDAIFDAQRFNVITTIVVDYQMPGLNGLEFLKEFSDIRAKKVLLTGIADAEIAIEAMENGLIDSYIKKHDNQLVNKLKNTIEKHRRLYFESISTVINKSINLMRQNVRLEGAYCTLIENIRQQHHATEYYLIDQNGSYIFIDQYGRRLDLLVKTKEQMESILETVQEQISDNDIVTKLKRRQLMVHTDGAGENRLFKAVPLAENEEIFYAISTDIFNIDLGPAVPYQALLNMNDAQQ